jgi:hypothetical protein
MTPWCDNNKERSQSKIKNNKFKFRVYKKKSFGIKISFLYYAFIINDTQN